KLQNLSDKLVGDASENGGGEGGGKAGGGVGSGPTTAPMATEFIEFTHRGGTKENTKENQDAYFLHRLDEHNAVFGVLDVAQEGVPQMNVALRTAKLSGILNYWAEANARQLHSALRAWAEFAGVKPLSLDEGPDQMNVALRTAKLSGILTYWAEANARQLHSALCAWAEFAGVKPLSLDEGPDQMNVALRTAKLSGILTYWAEANARQLHSALRAWAEFAGVKPLWVDVSSPAEVSDGGRAKSALSTDIASTGSGSILSRLANVQSRLVRHTPTAQELLETAVEARGGRFPFEPASWRGPTQILRMQLGVWVLDWSPLQFTLKMEELDMLLRRKIAPSAPGWQTDVFISHNCSRRGSNRNRLPLSARLL
ncbi:hypothetical protein OAO87_03515, partial [bacterium]|nr:hypothetical protein [bacterium]